MSDHEQRLRESVDRLTEVVASRNMDVRRLTEDVRRLTTERDQAMAEVARLAARCAVP